jgi:hypothetical protein
MRKAQGPPTVSRENGWRPSHSLGRSNNLVTTDRRSVGSCLVLDDQVHGVSLPQARCSVTSRNSRDAAPRTAQRTSPAVAQITAARGKARPSGCAAWGRPVNGPLHRRWLVHGHRGENLSSFVDVLLDVNQWTSKGAGRFDALAGLFAAVVLEPVQGLLVRRRRRQNNWPISCGGRGACGPGSQSAEHDHAGRPQEGQSSRHVHIYPSFPIDIFDLT